MGGWPAPAVWLDDPGWFKPALMINFEVAGKVRANRLLLGNIKHRMKPSAKCQLFWPVHD
jgi:hypothetical protein